MSDVNLLETTDAKIWADEFVRIKNENGWQLKDIDEGLMIGWFANMWAATNDPSEREIQRLRDALISIRGWREIGCSDDFDRYTASVFGNIADEALELKDD